MGAGNYTLPVSSLVCATTYYYQAYAINIYGENDGSIENFTTSNCSVATSTSPTATTTVATSTATTTASTATSTTTIILPGNIIGDTWAILYGTISAGANLLEVGFHYGTSGGQINNTVATTTDLMTGDYFLEITNLTCNTAYSYQAYAVNSAGEGDGVIQTFTTLACSQPTPVATTTSTTTTPVSIASTTAPTSIASTTQTPIAQVSGPIITTTQTSITPSVATTTTTTQSSSTQNITPTTTTTQITTQQSIIPNVIKSIAQTYSQTVSYLAQKIQSFVSVIQPSIPQIQNPTPSSANNQLVAPTSLLGNTQQDLTQTYVRVVNTFSQTEQAMIHVLNSSTGSIMTKLVAIGAVFIGSIATITGIVFANPIVFSLIIVCILTLIYLFDRRKKGEISQNIIPNQNIGL
jgi:hypothetical protein